MNHSDFIRNMYKDLNVTWDDVRNALKNLESIAHKIEDSKTVVEKTKHFDKFTNGLKELGNDIKILSHKLP